MRTNFKQYQGFKEVEMAYNVAVHALREYREWRDNNYIGLHLGHARDVYVAILRRRVSSALEAYKLVRSTARRPVLCDFREAA